MMKLIGKEMHVIIALLSQTKTKMTLIKMELEMHVIQIWIMMVNQNYNNLIIV
jgi:hypothetical protein